MIKTPKLSNRTLGGSPYSKSSILPSIKELEAEAANCNSENTRLTRKIQTLESEIKRLETDKLSLIESTEYENEHSKELDKKIDEMQRKNEEIRAELTHIQDEKNNIEIYVTSTKSFQQLQKSYYKAKQTTKENTTKIFTRGGFFFSNSSTEDMTMASIDNQVAQKIDELNDKIEITNGEKSKTRKEENKDKMQKKQRNLLIEETFSYNDKPSAAKKNVYVPYKGKITWESVLSECERITKDFPFESYDISPYVDPLPDRVSRIRAKLMEIEEAKDNLIDMKHQIDNKRESLNKASKNLMNARIQLENEENDAEQEALREGDLRIEIELCETQIASKRKEIVRIQKAIAETNKTLAQQNMLRNDLMHNLNDLIMKEKPEITRLSNEVESWRISLKDITDRLDSSEAELKEKNDKVTQMRDDPTIRELLRMKEKKIRIEKKIAVLKNSIKKEDVPRDNYQQIYDQNMIKINNLKDQISKLERQTKEEQNNIKDLTYYSDTITAFLRENKK